MRLAFAPPLFPDNLFGHLVATAVPGVEEWRDGCYRRTLRLAHGGAVVALAPRADHIACRLRLADERDRAAAIACCRRLLDLEADPVAIDAQLARDPHLAALVAAAPGRRVPGAPIRPSSPCAPCSASRSRRRPHAPTPRVSWSPTASRSPIPRAA